MDIDIKYEWERYGSLRKGGRLSYSLKITCTRWFKTEKIPFRLVDGSGQLPPKDGYVELEAGRSVRIDYDTYDWDWCNGDMIIIFDRKGREYDRKVFLLKTYAPGECPECHSSHQCQACRGTGRMMDALRRVSTCTRCLGTGICQTCYVPTRQAVGQTGGMNGSMPMGTMANSSGGNVELSRQRKIEALRSRIRDLRQQIERMEWEERTRNIHDAIHGMDATMGTVNMSRSTLKYTYEKQLIELQAELEQLERGGM